MANKTAATALTLPPGSAVTGEKLKGDFDVTITNVFQDGDYTYATVQYPDGFIKDHAADSVETLIAKVIAQVKGRFGNEAITVVSMPDILEPAIIELEAA